MGLRYLAGFFLSIRGFVNQNEKVLSTDQFGDPFGNQVNTADSYQINDANEYTDLTRDGLPTQPAYDASGNLTQGLLRPGSGLSAGQDVMANATYDVFGRIFSITSGQNQEQHYRYDALGRRVAAMEINGPADVDTTPITEGRRYIYDGWSVVEERIFDNGATLGNAPNSLERIYVNGRSIDEPLLSAIDGDGDGLLNSSKNTTNGVNLVDAEYYYLSNRLGSISAILDADNQDRILEYYRYEVFGSATVLPIVDTSPVDGIEDTPLNLNDNNASGATLVSSFGNTYLYTARRFDDITGLYYYRNRYYDPRSGRFFTKDPIRATRYNLYNYVNHRTTRFTDPSGKVAEEPERYAASVAGAEARWKHYCKGSEENKCGQVWKNCACEVSEDIKKLVEKSDWKVDHAMDEESDINAENAKGNNLKEWLLCIGACIVKKYDDFVDGAPSTEAWKAAQGKCSKENCQDYIYETRIYWTETERYGWFWLKKRQVRKCKTFVKNRKWNCCKAMVEAEQKAVTDCESKCGRYLTNQWGKVPKNFIHAIIDFGGESLDMASESERIRFGKNKCCNREYEGYMKLKWHNIEK